MRHLARLISDDFDAIAPIQPDGRVQPLCAFYRVKSCLKVVEEPLAENRIAPPLRAIFEHVETRFVRFDEVADLPNSENFFLNANTAKEMKRAEEIAGRLWAEK